MTPQERDTLLPFLDKLRQARLSEKDAEADSYIHQALQEQPDMLYMLVQTTLMQDFALHQAQAEIQKLHDQAQSQPQQPAGSGGFLKGLFGGSSGQAQPQQNSPWGQPRQQPYMQPQPAPQAGQPSFLRSAAQTAAGIAGGALLFQGIEGLLGGGRGFGMGGFGGGFGGAGPMGGGTTEIINNNYYDQAVPDDQMGVQGDDSSFDTGGDDDSFGI